MKKGFIYTALRPPFKFFTYDKPEIVRKFEEMVKEVHGVNISLDDKQSFYYEMGYKMGCIDAEYETVLMNLKGEHND